MAIILDADVVIRGEKGTFDLQNWVASRRNDRFESFVAEHKIAALYGHSKRYFRAEYIYDARQYGVTFLKLEP